MRKNKKKPVDFDPVSLSEEMLEEVPAMEQEEKKNDGENKSIFTRLLGVLLFVLGVVPFFVAVQVIKGSTVESMSMLNAVSELFSGNTTCKLLGILPVFGDASCASASLNGIAFYVFFLGLLATAVCGIIVAATMNKRILVVASAIFAFSTGAYALSGFVLAGVMQANAGLDIVSFALMLIGAAMYLTFAIKKNGKKIISNLITLGISFIILAVFVLCVKDYNSSFNKYGAPLNLTSKHITIFILGFGSLCVLYDALRLMIASKFKIDVARYIVGAVVSAVVAGAAIVNKDMTFLVLAAITVILSIVLPVLAHQQRKSKQKHLEEEFISDIPEVEDDPEPQFVVEEFAEALPYDGGPVEGVELAQEVNPTFEDSMLPTHVNTAGYDFYNCKSFDPFIAILNNEERNQFTEIFILKYKGLMPEIPDYQVGGDNKEFFRKLFIYLGQYRDRVPDGLLAKIYQFNIKM